MTETQHNTAFMESIIQQCDTSLNSSLFVSKYPVSSWQVLWARKRSVYIIGFNINGPSSHYSTSCHCWKWLSLIYRELLLL